jgi:hypothetical protein
MGTESGFDVEVAELTVCYGRVVVVVVMIMAGVVHTYSALTQIGLHQWSVIYI